jgi:hypothetical protein
MRKVRPMISVLDLDDLIEQTLSGFCNRYEKCYEAIKLYTEF